VIGDSYRQARQTDGQTYVSWVRAFKGGGGSLSEDYIEERRYDTCKFLFALDVTYRF
jgi:hypothetical protein